jgi:hypothetical protein
MKRITIGHIEVAQVVCPWLIRRFIGACPAEISTVNA